MSFEIEQRVPFAEHILQRAAVLKPHMRDTDAGTSMRRIHAGIPFGHIAGLIGDKRRAGIAVAELDTSHIVHAPMIDTRGGRNLRTQCATLGSVVANIRLDELAPEGDAPGGPSGGV